MLSKVDKLKLDYRNVEPGLTGAVSASTRISLITGLYYATESISKTKSRQYVDFMIWLGICSLFQTFEELDSVNDKLADAEAIKQLMKGDADV